MGLSGFFPPASKVLVPGRRLCIPWARAWWLYQLWCPLRASFPGTQIRLSLTFWKPRSSGLCPLGAHQLSLLHFGQRTGRAGAAQSCDSLWCLPRGPELALLTFLIPQEGKFVVPGWPRASRWMGERGAEINSYLGSSCGSCSAAGPGMCQTPVCQGPNLGGSCFRGDGGRDVPADGALHSAAGSRERGGAS